MNRCLHIRCEPYPDCQFDEGAHVTSSEEIRDTFTLTEADRQRVIAIVTELANTAQVIRSQALAAIEEIARALSARVVDRQEEQP